MVAHCPADLDGDARGLEGFSERLDGRLSPGHLVGIDPGVPLVEREAVDDRLELRVGENVREHHSRLGRDGDVVHCGREPVRPVGVPRSDGDEDGIERHTTSTYPRAHKPSWHVDGENRLRVGPVEGDMHDADLTERTALVTGSAAGIGRGILLELAACGADVAIHYHSSAEAAAATAEEARELGVAATAVQGDVTDPAGVDSLFEAVEADLGSVDVLVNNVGDFAPSHWSEIDIETWDRVLATNLTGTMLCAKRALPAMREATWGRIVNVGYAGADRALVSPTNFPYLVAKTGVLMFTRMLAADTHTDGVTVNAVSPYVVETSDEFPEEAPRGRWATVDDVANAVAFFTSERSDYVSGENVEIDGGWLPEAV